MTRYINEIIQKYDKWINWIVEKLDKWLDQLMGENDDARDKDKTT